MITSRILATFVAFVASSFMHAAEPLRIPLTEVWAYRMPGLRDVTGLEVGEFDVRQFRGWGDEDFSRMRSQAISDIASELRRKKPSEPAANGFVFPGRVDAIALRNLSHRMRVAMQGKPVFGQVKDDTDATLIFYTHPSSYGVQLTGVERSGNGITVHYQFVPHKTSESTINFALIPLGKLIAGEYRVQFEETPMERKFHEAGCIGPSTEQVGQIICQSFTFTVQKSKPIVADKSGDEVPLDTIWALQMPGTKDVRELDPRLSNEENTITRIGRILTIRTGERARAGPCFVVSGEGRDALLRAAKVLVDGKAPMASIPAGENVSLVFYSYAAPGYVIIESVHRSAEHLTINYKVVVHQSSNITVHFALIPLGKLAPGKLTINTVEVDSGGPDSDPVIKERAICDSCSIAVREGGTHQ